MWAPVASALANRHTAICADLRGYGESSKPLDDPGASSYAFHAMALDQPEAMQALSFDRFHLNGHDRGDRVAHRLALDHPQAASSLTVMDIAPTLAMFEGADRHLAQSYWHLFFLAQLAPFSKHLIEGDPDFFFEVCLTAWGGMALSDFDPELLDHYRRSWRDKRMIHGSCAGYRAAAIMDLEHDAADAGRMIDLPHAGALWRFTRVG
ncbi:alpha/beta fold hydrolase [Sphingobium sp. HWE2-09]|uniref:alpha/beta fold hydrolase n=1 Tax=Sphingobium sp. HWE2-09 TaxID=3108390 RepID=UPI002DD0FD81|nr:alpha/beta fold hydrolase [Sphingobium sp. HWE2-09]